MDEKISQLIEKNLIIDVINCLFIFTDEKNWEKVRECFAEEVLFDMTSMSGGEPRTLTPVQITGGWEEGLKKIHSLHHQSGNFIVTHDAGGAAVKCYAVAIHYLPNPAGRNTRTFAGSYDFHLSKINDKWKIDKFRFNLKFIDGNKELETSSA